MNPDVVAAVIGPVLTAALAGAALLIKERRLERRWEHQRDRILEQGRKEVAFIGEWVAAYERLAAGDPSRTAHTLRALADLERSYQKVSAQVSSSEVERPHERTVRERVTALLLIGVRRPWARLSRVFYYVALGSGIFSAFFAVPAAFRADEYSVLVQLVLAVLVTLLYFVPAVVLHWLTRRLEAPRAAPGPVRPSPAPPPVAPPAP